MVTDPIKVTVEIDPGDPSDSSTVDARLEVDVVSGCGPIGLSEMTVT